MIAKLRVVNPLPQISMQRVVLMVLLLGWLLLSTVTPVPAPPGGSAPTAPG